MELLFAIVLCLIALIRGESLESRPVAYEYFDGKVFVLVSLVNHYVYIIHGLSVVLNVFHSRNPPLIIYVIVIIALFKS